MKILLVGGGTSGHILPALSVGLTIKKENPKAKFLFIGSLKPSERQLVVGSGFKFVGIPAGKWRRYFDLRNLWDLVMIIIGTITAFFRVLIFWPDKIFVKGGYVGVPVGLAAALLRRPIFLHESDTVMGLANRILLPLSQKVCVAFPLDAYNENLRSSGKLISTGVPINEVFFDKTIGATDVKSSSHKPMILVTGGSQGARVINQSVKAALSELLKKYQVIHLTGGLDYQVLNQWAIKEQIKDYQVVDFLPNTQMATLMKQAKVIVTRSGATSIFEISAVKKPAIVIPLKGSAGNHQWVNGQYLAEKEMAIVINQDELTPEILMKKIEKVTDSDLGSKLATNISGLAKRDASKRIAEIILG